MFTEESLCATSEEFSYVLLSCYCILVAGFDNFFILLLSGRQIPASPTEFKQLSCKRQVPGNSGLRSIMEVAASGQCAARLNFGEPGAGCKHSKQQASAIRSRSSGQEAVSAFANPFPSAFETGQRRFQEIQTCQNIRTGPVATVQADCLRFGIRFQ